MQRSLLSFVSAAFILQALPAMAMPLVLGRSEAVADARRDPGTGICGSVTKFVTPPMPLVVISEAEAILNKPNGDSGIVGRISRLFQSTNFSVGTGSEADFRPPSFNDDIFPYCLDPNAMPMGADDNYLAMRIRGYINITDTMGGQPVTFAVKCDDACVLKLGTSKQTITQANDDSPQLTGRRARWVVFQNPGLYPVELVYFQNSTTGYLEWSRALTSVFSGDDVSVDNVAWGQNMSQFKPLSGPDLYSAIVGSNPACIECGAPGMNCNSGSYCGDGLCQSCNVSDHCGPSCQRCPARDICSAGKCVQCTSDSMCVPGGSCDIASGACLPPVACSSDTQCASPQICRPGGYCGNPPTPCKTDAECLSGQICTPGKLICCFPVDCGDPVPRLVATGCTLGAELPERSGRNLNAALAILVGLSVLLALTKRARLRTHIHLCCAAGARDRPEARDTVG